MSELALIIEKELSTYARIDDNDLMVIDSNANKGYNNQRKLIQRTTAKRDLFTL